MSEEEALVTIEQPRALAIRPSPVDALATMSDAEFEQRLAALKTAQKRMARIQREMMEKDTDYGAIPGTGDKPTLLKPGAERLCAFHKLVPTFEERIEMGDGQARPHFRVSMKCSLHYLSDNGPIVGQGLGAANSWEKKYRWRDAQRLCPKCSQPTIFKSKEKGWFCWAKKGGCGAQFAENDAAITNQVQGRVENPDPFDMENTLIKMAAKRAYVDATLRATATSGLFTQDVEDMEPPEPKKPPTEPPKPAPDREPTNIERNVANLRPTPDQQSAREATEPRITDTQRVVDVKQKLAAANDLMELERVKMDIRGLRDELSSEEEGSLRLAYTERKAQLTKTDA